MNPKDNTDDTRSFFNMLEWPSALGLGGLASFLFSLKQVNPEVRFEVNIWSWIILVAGTLIAWRATRSVFRAGDEQFESLRKLTEQQRAKQRKKRMLRFGLILGGGMLISLAYSLKDVPQSKRWDVTVGVCSALIFVSVALYFFWRLVQFLERHGQPENEMPEDPQQPGRDQDTRDKS